MPGLESTAAAFQSGGQLADELFRHKRERKEMLSDEDRRLKVQDLIDQRLAIRDKLGKLSGDERQKAMDAMAQLETNLDQIYHPIHAPGALQKDWDWLKAKITRQKPAAAIPAPVNTFTSSGATFQPAPQTVTLPATGPDRTLEGISPGTLAQQITMASPELNPAIQIPPTKYNVGPALSESMASPKVKGLVAPGNLPVWDRPVVENEDGSHSSEFSISFVDENPDSKYYGKEVLVPTIADGKFLTPDGKKPEEGSDAEQAMKQAAMDRYKATGQHLGVFDNSKSADKYANTLHSRGERPQPSAAAYEPKVSKFDRQKQAQQDRGKAAAELLAMGAPLSLEQEAQAKIDSTLSIADKLMGDNWDDDDRERFKQSLLYSITNTTAKEKFMTQLATTTDAAGKQHYWRVPLEPGRAPEEVDFNGQTMVPKTTKIAGLKFDNATGQVFDPSTGKRYTDGDPSNPPDVARMFMSANLFTAKKQAFQERLMRERGASYGFARQMAPISVLDTANGNAPTMTTYVDMMKNPGRYLPSGEADKSLARENLMQDIMGTSALTRKAINGLREDFPIEMKAKILLAMRADDPHASLDQLLASGSLGTLPDDQWEFLVTTRQLAENAMAMRSILGAGQGSDDVRTAIRDTLPGLLTPDRQKALAQLDAFDKTIARLHRGVPKVPLRTDLDSPATGGAGNATRPKDAVRIKNWTDPTTHKVRRFYIDKDGKNLGELP